MYPHYTNVVIYKTLLNVVYLSRNSNDTDNKNLYMSKDSEWKIEGWETSRFESNTDKFLPSNIPLLYKPPTLLPGTHDNCQVASSSK